MALVSGNITTTQTAATGLTVLDMMVQQYLVENAVLIPTIWDRTEALEQGAKSVDITRRSGFVAESKTEGSDYTAQSITWTADTLTLDKQEGVYVQMTGKARLQSAFDQESNITIASIEALAEKLEGQVYTALAAVAASSPDHKIAFQTTDTLSLSDINRARLLLNKQKVPKDNNRFLAINSDQEADLLDLEQFIHADKYGNSTPLVNGEIGRIYGFRILVTENVTASTALAYHRSHVAFCRQLGITFERDRNLQNDLDLYLMQTLYGIKTLDAGVRGVLLNNTGA